MRKILKHQLTVLIHCQKVYIHAKSEYVQFQHRGGPVWQAKLSLDQFRGKNTKVTLTANLEGGEESKYATLLEYHI
jgi:hypothetical protein